MAAQWASHQRAAGGPWWLCCYYCVVLYRYMPHAARRAEVEYKGIVPRDLMRNPHSVLGVIAVPFEPCVPFVPFGGQLASPFSSTSDPFSPFGLPIWPPHLVALRLLVTLRPRLPCVHSTHSHTLALASPSRAGAAWVIPYASRYPRGRRRPPYPSPSLRLLLASLHQHQPVHQSTRPPPLTPSTSLRPLSFNQSLGAHGRAPPNTDTLIPPLLPSSPAAWAPRPIVPHLHSPN